jgi:hypothetical protein
MLAAVPMKYPLKKQSFKVTSARALGTAMEGDRKRDNPKVGLAAYLNDNWAVKSCSFRALRSREILIWC